MASELSDDKRAIALFGKTRRGILSLLFSRPDEDFYLRQIARATGNGQGAVQVELKRLSESGIILRMLQGKYVFYKANQRCPIYDELRNMIMKTTGVVSVFRSALYSANADVDLAFIYILRGQEDKYGSDEMNMVVIADSSSANIPYIVRDAAEKMNREINVMVFTPDEFIIEVNKPHGQLIGIEKFQKHFVIGNEKTLRDCNNKQRGIKS